MISTRYQLDPTFSQMKGLSDGATKTCLSGTLGLTIKLNTVRSGSPAVSWRLPDEAVS